MDYHVINSPPIFPTLDDVDLGPATSKSNKKLKLDKLSDSLSKAISTKDFKGPREEGNFTLGCSKLFHTRTRFLIMILVLLCLASIWSNILCFNFAIICIGQDSIDAVNSTSAHNSILFTSQQRLYLTAVVAASAIVANFVVVSLVNNYGVRTVFAILGMLSAIGTIFMPLALQSGFYYTLGVRILQGVAFAANFPVIGAFASKWTYYKQNGLFVAILVANFQLSPAISMPASGAICSTSFGWPFVFYAHGVVSAILFILFGLLYRNSPSKHPCVGDIELKKISLGKSLCSKDELKRIPYGPILKTAAVWAIWIAAFGNFLAANTLFLYAPDFLHHVLNFPVKSTGLSASIPPILQFTLKLLSGLSSDKIRFISETNKLRIYNSIAFFGSAMAFFGLAFMSTSYSLICLGLLGMTAGALGFATGGFFKSGPLLSRHYSHFVTGNISLGITLSMLVVPFIVTGLAPNNTSAEWRNVFIVDGTILIICNLIFVLMCSADPAHWTTDEFSRSVSRNRVCDSSTKISNIETKDEFGLTPFEKL